MKALVIAAALVAQLVACSDMPTECFSHPSNLWTCESTEINGVRYHFNVDWDLVPLRRY